MTAHTRTPGSHPATTSTLSLERGREKIFGTCRHDHGCQRSIRTQFECSVYGDEQWVPSRKKQEFEERKNNVATPRENIRGRWKRRDNTCKQRNRKFRHDSTRCWQSTGNASLCRRPTKQHTLVGTADSQLRGSTSRLPPFAPSTAASPDQGASGALPKPRPGTDILEHAMATAVPYGAFPGRAPKSLPRSARSLARPVTRRPQRAPAQISAASLFVRAPGAPLMGRGTG